MYVNFYDKTLQTQNYTITQLLNNEPFINEPNKTTINTISANINAIETLAARYKINNLIKSLKDVIALADQITPENIKEFYMTFKIPKHSGGLRTINAPQGVLKIVLQGCYEAFKRHHVLPHNAAYAYTEKRDCYEALKKHQTSNWFLKLDIKDFFPSCNKELLMSKLKETFPFTYIALKEPKLYERLIDLCLLDDELPQGTNMSPLLTNILMVPFDVIWTKFCSKHNRTYTRYADDILISSEKPFYFTATQEQINKTFNMLRYPFQIKKEKTRYGSVKGANWNLGLMLNKDHNITIGYRKKKQFKAILNNFLHDLTEAVLWNIMDIYELQGLYSYYHRIEPKYIDYLVDHYSKKYHRNVIQEIQDALR